jgi:transcriptional regulator with GAF, ATPase, and Fis domain
MRELFAQLEPTAGRRDGHRQGPDCGVHSRQEHACERPFVVFDCGAVSRTVIEWLFGHERGAFTGAQAVPGLFEQAGWHAVLGRSGAPLELQPKLLRVLERREVRRVGGRGVIEVDVRIIAATNRNLRVEMQRAAFRQDLYYRLAQSHVVVPPLRDREGDVDLLLEYFWRKNTHPQGRRDRPTLEMFRFTAGGNVRELKRGQRLIVTPDKVFETPSRTRSRCAGTSSRNRAKGCLHCASLAVPTATPSKRAYVQQALAG